MEKNKEKKMNRFCIVGFICSFIFFVLGLLLCFVGFYQAQRRNEKGDNLAIAGCLISIVKLFLVMYIDVIFPSPSISPNLILNTACSVIDENGNYSKGDTDGKIICENYVCTVTYNNKEFTKKCN